MKLHRRIRECEQQIQNLKTLPYYTIFNRKAEQERDIKELEEKIKAYSKQSQSQSQLAGP